MRTICELNGIDPLVERSRSGRGAHIWIFFDHPISAAIVRKFGFMLLEKGAEQVNLKSFKYYDRMLPAQDTIPEGGLGNLIALPLQGKALIEGNSAFIDKQWNVYSNQWKVLWSKPKLSIEFIESKLKEWSVSETSLNTISKDMDEKPWELNKKFNKTDVNGKLNIILSNGIYIDTSNLNIPIQNKIRRMAAISNPIFYKNQAIGIANFNTRQWIYLGEDYESGYIQIPRGLFNQLILKLVTAGIEYNIIDKRQSGKYIKVDFKGELWKEQQFALEGLTQFDHGILQAATAFGKTVVCSALIAHKKVNTLIILESSALLDQWKNTFEEFLDIKEELPKYKTKTGGIKVRENVIGQLHGSHDSMTGIVDIAMAGSLCKKGEWHQLLEQYGMIIVDECHHAASETIANILKEVKAKYVYGVTATPKRSDGLEKINYMLIGPIRYSYTAKERALAQGIEHFVYPRFTRTFMPDDMSDKMHPNEVYELIRNNEIRDNQIVSDIMECIKAGRTPVVLSKYKDHSERLYEKIKNFTDRAFIMTGNNSKKDHKKICEQLQTVSSEESLVLVATGSLIGEGFNFPRLDTLIMATPVSFRSVVEQYAGRLNRDYNGKKDIVIYDYVDSHISMFNKMYAKRLKAYDQIGYEVCTTLQNRKQDLNSIFNGENYWESLKKDLLEANKDIIISSPIISSNKVYKLIHLLKEKQNLGLQIIIVTWHPDFYGFGDIHVWEKLHNDLEKAGFIVKKVKNICVNFVIIDQEIVWYGNINLLAKVQMDDNMMRVKGKEIAAELMELTYEKENESKI